MTFGDKLFKQGGWSSKKYNGTLLIIAGVLLAVVAMLIYTTHEDLSMVELMIPSGTLLTSGLGCFGVDSVNKRTQKKYGDAVQA